MATFRFTNYIRESKPNKKGVEIADVQTNLGSAYVNINVYTIYAGKHVLRDKQNKRFTYYAE